VEDAATAALERLTARTQAAGTALRSGSRPARERCSARGRSPEAQIAQLARDGPSNPEIGAQLFLSARTVEWHLHKVVTKLGIGSRKELGAALGTRAPSPLPVS
jgi:DNA-binding NarL/FixJ family response regulator